MLFKYKCGHEGTEGFWKDDDWMYVNDLCRRCKMARAPRKLIVLGTHRLFIRLKKGGKYAAVKPIVGIRGRVG